MTQSSSLVLRDAGVAGGQKVSSTSAILQSEPLLPPLGRRELQHTMQPALHLLRVVLCSR